jgi:hypothetical protein
MPPLYLVKFNQLNIEAAAHWGIFLPHDGSAYDQYGVPHWGTLYHASKPCNGDEGSCYSLAANTQFHATQRPLSGSPGLISLLPLRSTEIRPESVERACHLVTENRRFNLVTGNCQEWVKEVIHLLINEHRIPVGVLEQMRYYGYTTLAERSVESSSSCFPPISCLPWSWPWHYRTV